MADWRRNHRAPRETSEVDGSDIPLQDLNTDDLSSPPPNYADLRPPPPSYDEAVNKPKGDDESKEAAGTDAVENHPDTADGSSAGRNRWVRPLRQQETNIDGTEEERERLMPNGDDNLRRRRPLVAPLAAEENSADDGTLASDESFFNSLESMCRDSSGRRRSYAEATDPEIISLDFLQPENDARNNYSGEPPSDHPDDVETSRPERRRRRRKLTLSRAGAVELYERAKDIWPTLSLTKKALIILIIVTVLGTLLFVSLFPASFVYVNYYEYAYPRSRITNAIDYDTLYAAGCYLMTPQAELVRFQATAHFVEMNLGVMNKEGLSIRLHIMLQYFLKPKEVSTLFKKYHFDYDKVIENLIESTVKNTAPSFSLEQFRLERKTVEAEIFKQIVYVLSGDCCDPCCPENCGPDVQCRQPHCALIGRCYPGHHVEVRYFQLGAIQIPEEVMKNLMRQVIVQLETEKEFYYQQKAVEEKKTTLLVQEIRNQAKERIELAHAQRDAILLEAHAVRNRDRERAYIQAFGDLFRRMNISTQETKASFIYNMALHDIRDNLFSYNYRVETAMSP